MRGTLFLVVGPCGAGKDSLIRGARSRLASDDRIHFPRRFITCPIDGTEDHIPVSPETFAARQAGGGFALAWQSHGLGYGIPGDIAEALAAGRSVVANVSRMVIDEARRHFSPVRVLLVTAPQEVLDERLGGRGHHDWATDSHERMVRPSLIAGIGENLTVIRNDDSLDDAITRFVTALSPSVDAASELARTPA